MSRWLLFLAMTFAIAPRIAAQELGTVAGTIVSAETGLPVPAASVMLVGTTIGVVADLDGRYKLSAPAGNYTMQVQSLGFKTELREKVLVRPGLTQREDIRLG
ncbi:MAG TPA: carboxypeptidase-like regulatory domain-containing protein, partial [Candidatus Udaeobacter sp.]|nr:carboxypeptidase-like regulatory domain-containing protein [Candidatus Udaeobacter sp.]